MRWTLLVLATFLAGCAADDPDLLTQAEAARTQALEAAGPEGDLSRMTGTLDMEVQFGDDVIEALADIDLQIHQGDAFTMLLSMDMQQEQEQAFDARFICTPERLTIVLDGLEETLDEPNTSGTCLDVDSTDPLTFLSAFEGLDDMGLGSLDMIPQATAAYTKVVRQGDALIATFEQVVNLQGLEVDISGYARIVDDAMQSTHTTVTGAFEQGGFDVAMDMTMAYTYHYGARTLGP